jgi:hypothetical protein
MNIFYYDIEGNVYPTQLDAVASNKPCLLYFYDREFIQVDWKTSPSENLDTLYKLRAQQIRDEYDYVIVCYSGGRDSLNILETFYYNNIHIDEIVVVGALSQDPESGSDANHNGDLYHNVFPTLNSMSLPNTKITIVDYTTFFRNPNDFTLINKYGNEWTKHIGGFKSVHNLFWYDFKKFVGKDNNKKTAYLVGSDKTRVFYDKQSSYVKVSDLAVNDYGANYFDENFTRLNFYTSPEKSATDIMRKQAHIMKMFRNIHISDSISLQNKLYYNLKNPITFESKKSIYTTVSARDKFMLNATNSEMYDMFIEGIKTINKYGSSTKKYGFFTRPYYIE